MSDPWRFWSATDIAKAISCPQSMVEANWPLIADALDARGLYDRDICLGVLPTIAIETASTFDAIHEYGTPARWAGYEGGAAYAGRGFIQITHLANYRDAGAALGVDLVSDPDKALDPSVSAAILAWFWATKGVRAKDGSHFYTMAELCREHDWEWVRRVVQGGTDGLGRLVTMAAAMDALPAPKDTPMPTYKPETPIETQQHDWDCAEQSTKWGLNALGRTPSDAWLEAQMLADNVESTELGLKLADGSRLASWITRQYADPSEGTPTIQASNNGSVSFDDVRSVAGSTAVLAGGRNWGGPKLGHWTGVRSYDSVADVLVLANPGGTGPVYGQQTLSRQQFADRGPWSMVVLQADGAATIVPEAPAPVQPAPSPADDPDAWIRAVAYLADNVAAISDPAERMKEAQRVREQYVGARPAA